MKKIFAINPGSTSTKIALFEDEKKLFQDELLHPRQELAAFPEISDQLPYRLDSILRRMADSPWELSQTDVFVGRCGGLMSVQGGTYPITELLLRHAQVCMSIKHPACLGPQLCAALQQRFGGEMYVVNPEDTDEFDDLARITGVKGVYRQSCLHILNQKETAIRYAAQQGKAYQDVRVVVVHMGGGISVAAHCGGRIIDASDAVQGDGPMAPTRCGRLNVNAAWALGRDETLDDAQRAGLVLKNGGLVHHLGTADGREIVRRIHAGDRHAKRIYDAMIYQIGKETAAYAAVLEGRVDAVILTGGLAHDHYLTEKLRQMIGWIAPVLIQPGEQEMEALAGGVLRVLRGQEPLREYTGVPVFSGFEEDR